MSHPRAENMPWLSPMITVQDVDKAVDFYSKTFGFEPMQTIPGDDGTTWHASMKYQDQVIMFGKEGAYGNPTKAPATSGTDAPISIYLYIDNVDNFHEDAVKKGAQSIQTPQDMFWEDRMCQFKDPNGYVWSFATNIRK